MNERKAPLLLFPTHYLGNFVLGLPWVLSVLERHPDAVVVLDAQFEGLAQLVLGPDVRLLLYPRKQIAKGQKFFSRLKHYWKFIRALRSTGCDTVLDLEGERFTGVLARLSGCNHRVGPAGKRAESFYTDIRDLNYHNHRFNAFGEIVEGYTAGDAPASHMPYRTDSAIERELDEKMGAFTNERPLVAIHPGASVPYKLWPRHYFVELVKKLDELGYRVMWVGAGSSDKQIIDDIQLQLGSLQTLSLCNQLSFPALCSLFRRCKLFVGSDSGPMHLAASTGLQVFALFGPSKESIWAPLGENSHLVRGTESCASDCDAFHCNHAYRCLQSLHPSAIIDAIAVANSQA